MNLQRKMKSKKKFIVIIGSLKFTKEMKKLANLLEYKGFKVLYPKPTPIKNKFRDVCKLFFSNIEKCDLVILYNHHGYMGNCTYNECMYAFKKDKPVYAVNPKYFGFTISNEKTNLDFICNSPLPKFYKITKDKFLKRRILILTNNIKKKYYESFWKHAEIESSLMIEDINKVSKDIINKPNKIDVLIVDNIETDGFITKLAYEYILSFYNSSIDIYLTEIPNWEVDRLSNNIANLRRLINSIVILKGQNIREFGNVRFLKIERKKENVIFTRTTTEC